MPADSRSSGRSEGSTVIDGQWLVLAAAVLWGTTGTAQAFAPPGATPAAVGTMRLVVGGLALLALAAARGTLWQGHRLPWRATAFGVAGIAAYQLCFFGGVARTGVAVGTVVGVGSAPILAGFLEWLFRGQRPGRRWMAATGLAVSGCVLLVVAGRTVNVNALGVVLALGAGLSYAVYTLAGKELLADQPPDKVMAILFSLGAVVLVPVLLTVEMSWLTQPLGALVAVHLGVVTVAIAYALFARGLAGISVATAVTLSLAEPLTAAALGVLVLGERLPPLAVMGVVLLLAGLAILSVGRRRRRRPKAID